MSNLEDENYYEQVKKAQEEKDFQESIDLYKPLDGYSDHEGRLKAVAWRSDHGWHVQIEGYPRTHFDSYLSDNNPIPIPIPNDELDIWIRLRPWLNVRKED